MKLSILSIVGAGRAILFLCYILLEHSFRTLQRPKWPPATNEIIQTGWVIKKPLTFKITWALICMFLWTRVVIYCVNGMVYTHKFCIFFVFLQSSYCPFPLSPSFLPLFLPHPFFLSFLPLFLQVLCFILLLPLFLTLSPSFFLLMDWGSPPTYIPWEKEVYLTFLPPKSRA